MFHYLSHPNSLKVRPSRTMKRDCNSHYFTQTQARATQTFPTSRGQEQLLLPMTFKGLIEVIHFTENLGKIETRFHSPD